MKVDREQGESRWPHRWAVLLACATFPLLWVGGLVTTTDAGMAVPDWPNTYGYNLFLYPWQTWLSGPWDLFIEHGHRLLASSVGMLTIGLLVSLLRTEHRRWLKGLGFAALALVIFQGVLGGMRVLLDERTLAMLHGCTGPLFFALTAAIVVFTSGRWTKPNYISVLAAANIRWLAVATAVLAYLQIVLGAVLRHAPVDAQPMTFMLAVKSHLVLAGVLALHILALVFLVQIRARRVWPVNRLSIALVGLLLIQSILGASTWVVKFAVPAWATTWISPQTVAAQDGGWAQTHVITAHVAIGSLILATATALALYAQRLLADAPVSQAVPRRELEAAI
ncbi:MAG: COX15/CtaA family protein [Pirellulales bacterium]|nr:COX15/CtaA family protein [Pirellulales bacterium]